MIFVEHNTTLICNAVYEAWTQNRGRSACTLKWLLKSTKDKYEISNHRTLQGYEFLTIPWGIALSGIGTSSGFLELSATTGFIIRVPWVGPICDLITNASHLPFSSPNEVAEESRIFALASCHTRKQQSKFSPLLAARRLVYQNNILFLCNRKTTNITCRFKHSIQISKR